MTKHLLILIGIIIFLPALSFAGAFQVVPPKAIFDFKKGAKVSVTISNKSEEKVTIQVDLMEWTQDEKGNEVYKPTKDIAYFPKIFNIEANKEGMVRLGYLGKQPDVEKTYRLFLRELPITKPGETAIKTAIQITIPVFIPAVKETQTNRMAIENTELSNGKIIVKVRNNGNSHIMASKIKAAGMDETGKETFSKEITGWYVLPGIAKPFPIDIASEDCLKSKTIKVSVEEEKSKAEAGMDVDAAQCAKAETKKEMKHEGIKSKDNGL